jgi:hypothetical protein
MLSKRASEYNFLLREARNTHAQNLMEAMLGSACAQEYS